MALCAWPSPGCGGVSRVAKGADCKSAGLRLRRFESYLPHQLENKREIAMSGSRSEPLRLRLVAPKNTCVFKGCPLVQKAPRNHDATKCATRKTIRCW